MGYRLRPWRNGICLCMHIRWLVALLNWGERFRKRHGGTRPPHDYPALPERPACTIGVCRKCLLPKAGVASLECVMLIWT